MTSCLIQKILKGVATLVQSRIFTKTELKTRVWLLVEEADTLSTISVSSNPPKHLQDWNNGFRILSLEDILQLQRLRLILLLVHKLALMTVNWHDRFAHQCSMKETDPQSNCDQRTALIWWEDISLSIRNDRKMKNCKKPMNFCTKEALTSCVKLYSEIQQLLPRNTQRSHTNNYQRVVKT